MANLQTYGNLYYDYNKVLKMYLGNTCVYSKTGYPDDYVDDGKLWVYYNVTTTDADTVIIHRNVSDEPGYKKMFTLMETDEGDVVDLTGSNSPTNNVTKHRFQTTGEHLVKYTIYGNVTYVKNLCASSGGYSQPVTKIYFPSRITEIRGLISDINTITGLYHTEHITSLSAQRVYRSSYTHTIDNFNFPSLTNIASQAIQGAFGNVINLGTITSIPDSTFGSAGGNSAPYCRKFVVPVTVTSIGSSFMWRSYNIKMVICKPTTPPTLGSSAFDNLRNYAFKIYVPKNSVTAYKEASNWSTWASKIEAIPDDYVY